VMDVDVDGLDEAKVLIEAYLSFRSSYDDAYTQNWMQARLSQAIQNPRQMVLNQPLDLI
jgi:hypothetical protein